MRSMKLFFLFSLFLILPTLTFAQGVTTGSINGIITSTDGEALAGANVVALHEPTGTSYGAATRIDCNCDCHRPHW